MRTDPRLIGFTAYRGHVPLSRLTHVTFSIRRSAVPIKERLHPSSRNSSSEFLRSCSSPSILRRPASPAVGFRSLFATSLERGYVYSQCLPRTASIRPQVFTTSRRFLPLSSLQAYFIPQPRPGSVFVQGLLSRRSHPSSSEGACLHAVAASPLPLVLRLSSAHARVHVRCLSASRPLSAPGRVPQVRLFTSPEAAPLLEFHAPPGPRSLDAGHRSHGRRPLMMLRVRSLRSYPSFDEHVRNHLRGTTFRVRPGNHRCSPRAVLQAVARSSRARLSTITFVRVSLREAVHRWLLALRRSASRAQQARSRPWPDLLASRARHLAVFRARSRFALLIFRPVERSESLLRFQSCGVAVRCISRRIVRSAMIRVPRDPFGHRAGPARARLATITTDPSSPPRCSNLPRSRSPRGDRARFGSLTSRVLGLFRMRSPFGNRLRTSSLTLRCSRSRTDSSPYSARSVQRPCSPRCSCPRPDSLTLRRSSPFTFTLTRAAARLRCSLEQHIHARPARAHVHVSCASSFDARARSTLVLTPQRSCPRSRA